MRVSVEIDEATLNTLRRLTGERKMSRAIRRAVIEFVRRKRVREFGRLLRRRRWKPISPTCRLTGG